MAGAGPARERGNNGVTDAELGEKDRGVPVGDTGAGGTDGDAQLAVGGGEMGVRGGVLRQSDEPHPVQFAALHPLPSGELVIGAHGEHPGQFRHGPLLDAAYGGPEGHPRQVEVPERVGQRVTASGARPHGLELQAHVRVGAPEVDDALRHEVPHGRAAGRDPYDTAVAAHQIGQAAQCEVQPGDAVGRRFLEHPPGPGGHDPAGLPLHQPDADLPLQPPHVLAHRRLGAAQLTGHRAEAPGPADGDEDTEIVEGHGATIPKVQLG